MAQSINLQITPNGVIPTIYASQFDVGREITFNLYDGSTAYIPPVGSTIRFEGKKSDGNGFSYNCTYVDNVVTVVLTDQMTVFAEDVQCELRIADINANDIGTLNVVLSVEKSPIDENTPMSDTEIPAIVELARAEQYSAEAWAEGTRNGVPVGPTDPTYQNNAKYYAEHSSASISNLQDTDIQNLTNGQILKYDSNSGKWVNEDESGGSTTLGGLTDVTLTTPTNNQVLKYDSVTQEWVNGDAPSGGAGGSEVTITTVESSLYGQTVTISDGQDTYTGAFDNTGLCIIQGVTITGSATVTSTDGVNTATGTLTMPYFGNYSIALSFFSATVNVTFPYANGATCTLSDGVTTLTANTSPMAFAIPNTGTWTATCTLDGQSKTQSFVITTDGQTESHTFEYGTINLTFDNEFRGLTITCANGGTVISKTAPISGNTMAFYPPSTGEWTISSTYSGVPYSTSATVVSLSTAVSAILQTNLTLTVTLYSAVEDTVTFTDASGAKTEVFASGQSSKSVSIDIPASGMSITFTSSVAKNPTDLSQYYSKTVTVNSGTTEVYVMPDGAITWFGCYKIPMENKAVRFGGGNTGLLNVTNNTNDVYIGGNTSNNIGGSYITTQKIDFSLYSTLKAYVKNAPTGNTTTSVVSINDSTNNTQPLVSGGTSIGIWSQNTHTTPNTVVSANLGSSTQNYVLINIWNDNGNAGAFVDLYALWLE